MLRTTGDFEQLCRHFTLGVNFIESLVNRHRLELYVVDAHGRIAARYDRIHWNEGEVVECALRVLGESESEGSDDEGDRGTARAPARREALPKTSGRPWLTAMQHAFGVFATIALVFFPKCPVCWAAYLSVFGIAAIESAPYLSELKPLLVATMMTNLAVIGWRARATGRHLPFCLVVAGAIAVVAANMGLVDKVGAMAGVVLTLAGSMASLALKRKEVVDEKNDLAVRRTILRMQA